MTDTLTDDQIATIASAIAAVAPPGWTRATTVVETVGPTTSSTTTAETPEGEAVVDARISIDARRVIRALRQQMYRPGIGTWFTATFSVRPGGQLEAWFDSDNEPSFDFAPLSWVADAERFPRTPEHTPAWLAAKTEQPRWSGATFTVQLTVDGHRRDTSRDSLDATTTAQARAWLNAIESRLRTRGREASRRQDDGEDGRGNPVRYDELIIGAGGGHMSLAFWRDIILWDVDVWPEHLEQQALAAIANDVMHTVRDVSGYVPGDQLDPYTRRILSQVRQ